jgi:hypothetical protein
VPAPIFSLPSKIVKPPRSRASLWDIDNLFKYRCTHWAISRWPSKRFDRRVQLQLVSDIALQHTTSLDNPTSISLKTQTMQARPPS